MKTLLLHSTLIAATTFSLGGCVTELDTTDVTGGTDPLADTSAKAAVEDGSGHQDTEMVGFHTGYGPARGHEDLVRFAVGMAND